MARNSLKSGSFSFLKRDRKITNNNQFNSPWIKSSSHIYRLKLIRSSQGLPRRSNAIRQIKLRTSIPSTRRPPLSYSPLLIISKRPVSRIMFSKKITVIIRIIRCRGKPILDSRSQWKKCYAGGSRLSRRTSQQLTWSTWLLSITHSTQRSGSSPQSTHNKPTNACYAAS